MLSGISTSASALLAEQQALAVTAHNVANASTPGFREVEVGREDAVPGVRVRDAGVSTAQGPVAHTGGALDLAIEGNGFFQVREADGTTSLTRDGRFGVNAAGRIASASDGAELVPPIAVPAGARALSVAPDGAVSADGVALGAIEPVDVPAPERLLPTGDGRYAVTIASGGPGPSGAGGARVQQGALELSNTDIVTSSVDLTTGKHSLAANIRAIEAQDELARALLGM